MKKIGNSREALLIKKKKGRGVVGEGMFPKFPQFPKRFILDRNPVKICV